MRLIGLAVALLAVVPIALARRGRLNWTIGVPLAEVALAAGGIVAQTVAAPLAVAGFIALVAGNEVGTSNSRRLGALLGLVGFAMMVTATYLIGR